MPNFGNYRRPDTSVREWMYFATWGEADVVGDYFQEEGIVTGPVQVRCWKHGWTPSGIGDVCAFCEQEIWDREMAEMEAAWEEMVKREEMDRFLAECAHYRR